MALPDVGLINYEDVPDLDAGAAIGADWLFLARDPATNNVFEVKLTQLVAVVTPPVPVKPTVVFITPNPAAPGTLQAGALVLLQVAATDVTGIASVTFATSGAGAIGTAVLVGSYYQLPYTIPLTATMLAVSATATNANGVTASASTFAFVTAALTPAPAPTFANMVDDAGGGSIQLVPAPGVPMADYRYKLGSTGVPVQAPADGIINVGNLAGYVYAYSVATTTREASPTSRSDVFNAAPQLPVVTFMAPLNGNNLVNAAVVLLRVSVTDPAALAITKVDFSVAGVTIGTGSLISGTSTWQLSYAMPVIGNSVTITAQATNSAGAQGITSSFVYLTQPAAVLVAPGPPTIGLSIAGDGKVTTTATAPADPAGAPITSFNLYYAGSVGRLASGLPTLTYVDSPVVNGQDYLYQWTAVNSVGEGPRSSPSVKVTPTAVVTAPVVVNTVPGQPTATATLVTVSGVSSALITIGAPASDGGVRISFYNVYRNGSSDVLGQTTSRLYTDYTALPGLTYNYTVAAVNLIGTSLPSLSTSIFIPVPVPTVTAPGQPIATAIVVNSTTTTSGKAISVNATTASDGGSPITGYAVYRNGTVLVPNVALPYVDSSPLLLGVAYNYTVAAINRVGPGPQSAVVSATIPLPTFNTTLNPGEAILTVTYGGAVGTQFKFNAPLSANANPNPAYMDVFLAGAQVGHVDFNGADLGTPCAVVVNGTQYLTTFAQGNVTIS